ncbi:cadherin-like protein 26 [Littorina saxatilis]
MMFGLSVFVFVGILNTVDTAATLTVDRKVQELYQYKVGSMELFKFKCTPAPGCIVSITNKQPSTPCSACFQVYTCPGVTLGEYCLNYYSGQGALNPRVAPRYVLTVQAIETATNEAANVLVEVRITPNSPPYFDYGQMSTTITIANAKTKKAGEPLGEITAIDDEKDTLTYTMTTVPNIEGIEIDQYSGYLRATKDLKSVCYSGFTGLVKVTDGKNTEAGPFLVNVELENANDPPYITNLNTEIFVRENENIDSNVYKLTAFDDGDVDNIVYTVSANPLSARSMFEIKNNNLKVKEALDYEGSLQVVTLIIQASDGFCESPSYTLRVRIADVNEPPVVLPTDQTIDSCEGNVTITPTWNVTDPEKNDSTIFHSIQSTNNGWFVINERTGVVTTTVDYDVDDVNKPKKSPNPAVLTVIVTDTQGLTGTATLSIRFSDCNDNAPYFTAASMEPIEVLDCLPPGPKGVLPAATDDDIDAPNNVVSYSGSGPGVEVLPSGDIVTTAAFTPGQVTRFPAYATDEGTRPGPLRSKNPIWVTIYGTKCLTTPAPTTTLTTTTTPRPTTSKNIAAFGGTKEDWAIGAIIVGVLLGLLCLFMLIKYGVPAMQRSYRKSRKPPARHARHTHPRNPGKATVPNPHQQ